MSASTTVNIRVFGDPKAQPRPRAFARKIGGKFLARVYEAGTAEGWKGCVALAAKDFVPPRPVTNPLRVHVVFVFRRPKWHFHKSGMLKASAPLLHTSRPDRDNLDKAVLDCLGALGFWQDDALVCSGYLEKRYTKQDEAPGAYIVIAALDLPIAA